MMIWGSAPTRTGPRGPTCSRRARPGGRRRGHTAPAVAARVPRRRVPRPGGAWMASGIEQVIASPWQRAAYLGGFLRQASSRAVRVWPRPRGAGAVRPLPRKGGFRTTSGARTPAAANRAAPADRAAEAPSRGGVHLVPVEARCPGIPVMPGKRDLEEAIRCRWVAPEDVAPSPASPLEQLVIPPMKAGAPTWWRRAPSESAWQGSFWCCRSASMARAASERNGSQRPARITAFSGRLGPLLRGPSASGARHRLALRCSSSQSPAAPGDQRTDKCQADAGRGGHLPLWSSTPKEGRSGRGLPQGLRAAQASVQS